MANKNRTEVADAIEALAAVVDLEELKEALNDFFAQSCVFRKDVSATDTAAGAKTLDFTDIDFISVTQSSNSTYTLSGIAQGEEKFLKITKGIGLTVSFASAIDTTPDSQYTSLQSIILYRITSKDGTNVYANPITKSVIESDTSVKGIVEKATNAEGKAGTTDKNITADVLQGLKAADADVLTGTEIAEWVSPAGLAAKDGGTINKVLEIGDWNMDTAANITFAHGEDITKIIGISAIIRNDTDSTRTALIGDGVGVAALSYGSSMNVTATLVSLNRVTSGVFDNTNYDSTSYNRGWVILKLLP